MSGVKGLSVSIKFNKQGIEKIRKQMEKELNRQIQIGVSDLRKDSEKFLEIVLREREKIGEDAFRSKDSILASLLNASCCNSKTIPLITYFSYIKSSFIPSTIPVAIRLPPTPTDKFFNSISNDFIFPGFSFF